MIFFCEEKSTFGVSYSGLEKKDDINPEHIKNHYKVQDILVIDFLHRNYIKQFRGAILNEELGFNSPFQVSTFLNRIFRSIEQKFLVLILTMGEDILKWHYHLTVHGGLKVQIIDSKTCPVDFDEEHGSALLLPYHKLKLSEALIGYSFFSVVMDHFDETATKSIIKKLQGEFNIGLTSRNFYSHPDQKLQWTMLNWSNPGCCGKLNDFYMNNSENFFNLCDNIHPWWFTLTWGYCETFHKSSDIENQDYIEKLSSWALANGLDQKITEKDAIQKIRRFKKCSNKNPRHKCKISKQEKKGEETECKIGLILELEHENFRKNIDSNASEDISESVNIIHVVTNGQMTEMTDETNSDSLDKTNSDEKSSHDVTKSHEDDIILSIINEEELHEVLDGVSHQSQLADKKKELMSDIFDDGEFLKNEPDTEKSDFLLSLI